MIDIIEALNAYADEVNYMDFYRDIFPEGSFEKKGVFEDGKYNGIAVSIAKGDNRTKRYTITDDLDAIEEMAQTDDFCIMSPISYAGKSRKSMNARYMYAMAIDLDGIESLDNWHFFIKQIEEGHKMRCFVWGLPKPTYLVSSGNGIHLYYVFVEPIPLFKNIVKQLEVLKKRITWQAWTQGASELVDNVQYESLFQGFRMVGTITKNGGRCRAFRTGKKVTVDYLNNYVPEDYMIKDFAYKSKLKLDKAKDKYPEWYDRRIVKNQPKKTWTCKKDLYNWWIRKIREGANQGHRYWCIMTLATYAKKCGVSREELEKDAYGLIPFMNTRGDAFTEDDVLHAIEAYTDSYITYPIDTIVQRTDIKIEKNKRNGRKQADHIKLMNYIRDEINNNKDWRNFDGRPRGSGTAQEQVQDWRKEHPQGKKADCIRDTNLSKPTVYKWWNQELIDSEILIEQVKVAFYDIDKFLKSYIPVYTDKIKEWYNFKSELRPYDNKLLSLVCLFKRKELTAMGINLRDSLPNLKNCVRYGKGLHDWEYFRPDNKKWLEYWKSKGVELQDDIILYYEFGEKEYWGIK